MPDSHHWIAHYSDGSEHSEIDETGASRGFASVEMDRVVALEWMPESDSHAGSFVRVPSDARPILFRRRRIDVNAETGEQSKHDAIHVLGWQQTIDGRNVKVFVALYADGSVLVTDDNDAI